MNDRISALSKVPAVTLGFWIIKIAATTLGETGGDTVTMTMNYGYLTGTIIFLALLAALVVAQIAARKFHPVLYWATIVASTTAGTTMADLGLVTPAALRSCSFACWRRLLSGTGRKGPYRSKRSARPR